MVRKTPIERAIDGEPQDRRRRWDQRMMESGYKRVGLWVPQERVALLKELKAQLVDEIDFEHLRDFLACDYLAMIDDPDCSASDRKFARHKLRELGVARVRSAATAHAAPSSSERSRV